MVYREGERDDNFYLVASGTYRASKQVPAGAGDVDTMALQGRCEPSAYAVPFTVMPLAFPGSLYAPQGCDEGVGVGEGESGPKSSFGELGFVYGLPRLTTVPMPRTPMEDP